MKRTLGVIALLGLAWLAVCAQTAAPAASTGPSLHLAFVGAKAPSGDLSKCFVTLTFVNKTAGVLVLDLGSMLDSGAKLSPAAVGFELKNANGKKVELSWVDSQPGDSGRVDDFVVALPPAATYQLKLCLNDFRQKGATGPQALSGGAYTLTAVYAGAKASHVNTDMQGVGTLSFWEGSARSQGLPFKCEAAKGAPASSGGG
jgi:hypothetical protein